MRTAERHHLIIGIAALVIGVAAFFYASLAYDWLMGPRSAQKQKSASPRTAASLQQARADFRADFLDPAAHMRLAETLYGAGRPVDAFYVMYGAKTFFGETAFLRAHALVSLYQNRFFLGSEEFDPSEANETRLKALLRESPNNPNLINYLAHIAAALGRKAEALGLVDTGLSYHADDRGLLAYRAQLSCDAGNIRGAIPFWARLASEHPGAFETRSALEELGKLAGRKPAGPGGEEGRLAMEALEELRRRKAEDPQIFATLAMSVWSRGDIAGVRALVAEAQSNRPEHAGAAMVEGALALQDRQVDKAIKRFTDAWEKNPEDLYSAAKLAQIYLKQRADREASLPFYFALYRANPRYDDGEPAERRIREALDIRRETMLKNAPADSLGRFFSSDDASLRAEACAKAAQFRDPRWLERLFELLDDDAEIVRHNADYALYQIARHFPDAVRVRRDEWLSAPQPLSRARALNLFADLNAEETFPFVLRALRDPHPAVRFLARVMVLDRYYQDLPAAAKARSEYLAAEKNPSVLALYARMRPS